MNNPTSISQVKQELAEIDALIEKAVRRQDVDEATRLESRKAVLPRILQQMEKDAAELENKIRELTDKAAKAKTAFDTMQARIDGLQAKIVELEKQKPSPEEYVQTRERSINAGVAVTTAKSQLARLRGGQ